MKAILFFAFRQAIVSWPLLLVFLEAARLLEGNDYEKKIILMTSVNV